MRRSGTPERHGPTLGNELVVDLARLVKHLVAKVECHVKAAVGPQIVSHSSLTDTGSLWSTISVWRFLSQSEPVAFGVLGRQDQHRFMKESHCRDHGFRVARYAVRKLGPSLLDPNPVPEVFAIQNDLEKEFESTPEEPRP